MVTVGYFDGVKRLGLLAWTHDENGRPQAVGGVDIPPGIVPVDPRTVVTRDDSELVLSGIVHPDNLDL